MFAPGISVQNSAMSTVALVNSQIHHIQSTDRNTMDKAPEPAWNQKYYEEKLSTFC